MDFHAATNLDTAVIAQVQTQIRQRILRAFVRRGLIGKDDLRAFSGDGTANSCSGGEKFHRSVEGKSDWSGFRCEFALTWRFPHEINAKQSGALTRSQSDAQRELVSQAQGMTTNLSCVIEQLLTEYVMKQNSARQEKMRHAEVAAQALNSFNESFGSFADEHSTL